jgi:hypothetical protein
LAHEQTPIRRDGVVAQAAREALGLEAAFLVLGGRERCLDAMLMLNRKLEQEALSAEEIVALI